jgi:acyl-CoA synthetase (AMP-forming)/AMP-acid ligase II
VAIEEETKEIVISGPQITEGYIGVESQAFVAPPSVYSKEHWAMRTGNIGWKDKEGRIYIEGRLDGRLSIFSLRIEQAETEAAALKVPEIDFAHLFVHELGEGLTPSLVLAYHVAEAPSTEGPLSRDQYVRYRETCEKQLREQMELSAPGYQRPSSYIPLGSIPRTISQKKDAKRIASLAEEVHRCGLVELSLFELAL